MESVFFSWEHEWTQRMSWTCSYTVTLHGHHQGITIPISVQSGINTHIVFMSKCWTFQLMGITMIWPCCTHTHTLTLKVPGIDGRGLLKPFSDPWTALDPCPLFFVPPFAFVMPHHHLLLPPPLLFAFHLFSASICVFSWSNICPHRCIRSYPLAGISGWNYR